jgi:hypothetical protein
VRRREGVEARGVERGEEMFEVGEDDGKLGNGLNAREDVRLVRRKVDRCQLGKQRGARSQRVDHRRSGSAGGT